MKIFFGYIFAAALMLLGAYMIVGTDGNIEEIERRAPSEINERGWRIINHEGYQYGKFGKHGGRVWYHVQDIDNPSIRYRVQVTLWNGRLEYYYGRPEVLIIIDIKHGPNLK